jgi:hypothetical protein
MHKQNGGISTCTGAYCFIVPPVCRQAGFPIIKPAFIHFSTSTLSILTINQAIKPSLINQQTN